MINISICSSAHELKDFESLHQSMMSEFPSRLRADAQMCIMDRIGKYKMKCLEFKYEFKMKYNSC